MQWTKERTGWLGTYREKRGSWHHLPYVVRVNTAQGISRDGWFVVVVTVLLMVALTVIAKLLAG